MRPASTLIFTAIVMLGATTVRAEPEALFPPATVGCYVGAEIAPSRGRIAPYSKPAVPVTAIRLERGYPQLVHEEEDQIHSAAGDRLINLRVIATFADANKPGMIKRYANGPNDLLRCTAELCDANNYKVERQADGSVLLRMTGGLFIGGGSYGENADRRLPDGHVYRLVASPMTGCR